MLKQYADFATEWGYKSVVYCYHPNSFTKVKQIQEKANKKDD